MIQINKNMKYLYTLLFILSLFVYSSVKSQCTAPSITPTSTSSCYNSSSYTDYSTSTSCAGSGFGGSGTAKIIPICTNGSADCIVFNYSGLPGSGGVSITLYSGCTGTTLSGYVSGSIDCYSNATDFSWSTANLGLSPSTCYYALVWSKNGFPGGSQFCTNTLTPSNDQCSGATPISSVPQSLDNLCTTPGPTTNTPTITPADLCAGSLENTAWYSFTVQNTADVIITIANIVCSGGGAGFQIGYFTGSCGTLTNIGCSSGSGGTVTATITGLTAGQQVTIAIDGNAGANCTYDISATNTVPLPIELLSFSAKAIENTYVELGWATVSEINNNYFTIERTKDGVNFEVVGIVDGAGNSTVVKNYDLNDNNPYSGISYYRLKQTDYDENSSYSRMVSVIIESEFKDLNVYPNPVTGNAQLNFTANKVSTIDIIILDISGRKVLSKSVVTTTGNNKFTIETEELSKGMYFLTLTNGSEISTLKFVKE